MNNMAHKGNKRKITSWVTSTFDDFDEPLPSTEVKSKRQKEDRFLSNAKNRQMATSALWVDVYAPTVKDDLAVHKKKIQEVESWLVESIAGMKGRRFLLLTGPSGCGKSATIKILAKEARLNVLEWINPLSRYDTPFQDDAETPWIPGDRVAPVSQSNMFKDFFIRTSKYQSVCDNSKIGNLILVEDFPNVFLRDPSALHIMLRHYHHVGNSPVVFVVSDSTNQQSSVKHLFPQDIQQELAIVNIQFNSIASSILLKALSRILNMKNVCEGSKGQPPPSKEALETLTEASGGDIRSAVNSLQFAVTKDVHQLKNIFSSSARIKGSSKSKSRSKTLDNTVKPSDNEDNLAVVGGKDASLFLFRALGKILYCKRDQEGAVEALPKHLHLQERLPLLEKAEDIYDRSAMGATSLGTFLHQNMMAFYPDIEGVSRALHHLTDSDVISAEWIGRNVLDDYAASVAIRGLMHENKNCSSGGAWRAFNRPQWFGAQKQVLQHLGSLKYEHQMASVTTEELTTVLVPFQAKIFEAQRKGSFTRTKELGLFTKQLMKYHGERLNENDAINTEDDVTESACNTEYKKNWSEDNVPEELGEDSEEDFKIEEYPED